MRGSREISQNTQEREKGETMRTEMGWDLEKKITGIQLEVGQDKASKSEMTA